MTEVTTDGEHFAGLIVGLQNFKKYHNNHSFYNNFIIILQLKYLHLTTSQVIYGTSWNKDQFHSRPFFKFFSVFFTAQSLAVTPQHFHLDIAEIQYYCKCS